MTENKPTDKEIIKALEIEIHQAEYVDSNYCNGVDLLLVKSTLDLINRQQATIETLRNCVEQHHIIRKDGKSPLSLLTEDIKAEAIKEFAERLKKKESVYSASDFYWIKYIPRKEIDNLVKEMVGEQG